MPQSFLAKELVDSSKPTGSGLSWADFPDRSLFADAKDAILTGPLPQSPWKAGEARPFSAFKVGYGTAASLGYMLSFVGFSCVANLFNKAGMPVGVGISQAMMGLIALAQAPVGVMVAEMSGRSVSVENLALSGKVAALSGKSFAANIAASSVWLAGEALERLGAKQSGARLSAFSDRCDKLSKMFKDQSVRKSLEFPELLTEIGAWRAAREFMSKGMAGSAAKLWLSRPFNPDWEVPWGFRNGNESVGFKEALKAAAILPLMSDQADYVNQTISVMEAVSEKLHLSEATPSAENKNAESKARKNSL